MTTKLAIWQQACIHLEKETLTSLTSNVEPRYKFAEVWDSIVREAFNEGDWNFAKKSAALVLNDVVDPAIGWNYIFDYPSDYERTLVVSNTAVFNDEFWDYVDQGGYLHANSNVLYLRYISNARTADAQIGTWPTMFWRYVAIKLAYETCGKLTSSQSLSDKLEKKLKKALRQAKSVDARNEPNKRLPTGSWLRARQGYFNQTGLGDTIITGDISFGEGDV